VDQSVQVGAYLFLFKFALVFAGSYLPHYFFSKCIAQRRIWSSWFVQLICAVVAIGALQFISPNSLGFQVLTPVPRFYVFFTTISLVPCFIIRSFSQDASPLVITVLFTILISYYPFFKNPLICSNALSFDKMRSFLLALSPPHLHLSTPDLAHSPTDSTCSECIAIFGYHTLTSRVLSSFSQGPKRFLSTAVPNGL
jgi:hypothetical protein